MRTPKDARRAVRVNTWPVSGLTSRVAVGRPGSVAPSHDPYLLVLMDRSGSVRLLPYRGCGLTRSPLRGQHRNRIRCGITTDFPFTRKNAFPDSPDEWATIGAAISAVKSFACISPIKGR